MRNLFSALILSLGWGAAMALTPYTVMLDWYVNPDHMPLIIGQQQGEFKKQGLEVKLLAPGQGIDPVAMVLSGKADAAVTYEPYLMLQVANGLPIVRVATLVNQPLACVTVLKSSGVKSIADLKGKTIGYAGSSLSLALFKTMLASAHLRLSDVNLINVQMDLSQALIANKVNGALDMMRNVEPLQLNMLGFATQSFMPENYGVPSYDELIIVVRKDHAHDPQVKALVAGLSSAMTYIGKHPELSWQIAKKAYPNQLAPTEELSNINHQIWLSTIGVLAVKPGIFDAERYQAFVNYLYQQQLIDKPLQPSDYNVSVGS